MTQKTKQHRRDAMHCVSTTQPKHTIKTNATHTVKTHAVKRIITVSTIMG